MTEGSNAAVYGVLLAVIIVGAAGLYFTVNTVNSPVVVLQSGGGPSVSLPPNPLRVIGHGITGADSAVTGSTDIDLSETIDITMPKNTITCLLDVAQGATSVVFNTCNDGGGIGGTPDSGVATGSCDGGTSAETDPDTCDGGFFLTNNGVAVELLSKYTSLSGPVDSLDKYIYNAIVATAGCPGVCNNYPNTAPLFPLLSTDTSVCDTFGSGGSICQCFSIHITTAANVLLAKSGTTPITFTVEDTGTIPAATCV